MTPATNAQKGLIHVLAGKAGMDEDMRRDFLEGETGKRSSKELSREQAAMVIDKMQRLAGGADGNVGGLDSPAAKKLRALWIAAYDLGLLADRSDRAMLAFLERQTGVSHTRFFSEPGQATAAIEALKSWLTREGKVAWPPSAHADPVESKRAVLNAQWMRLIETGAVEPFLESKPLRDLDYYAYKVVAKHGWQYFAPADYDKVQKALGKKLRVALSKTGAPR